MKNTGKLAFCSMMAALATVFMLTSYFPYLTYAIPALAGLFIMAVVIEVDKRWATIAYFASAVLVFLMAEPEAKMLYIMFFGYYPIIKSAFEGIKSRLLEYVLKFAVFNCAIVAAYLLMSFVFDIAIGDMGDFGKYTSLILLIAANVVFPIYDIAVSRMAQFYIVRVHPSVNKILKGK